MFCSNCGTKIEDGDLVCSMCGKKVVTLTSRSQIETKRISEAGHIGAKIEELGWTGQVDAKTTVMLFLINPVTYIMSGIHRGRAKKALKNGDIETAKKELATAKTWFLAGILIFLLVLTVLGVMLYNSL